MIWEYKLEQTFRFASITELLYAKVEVKRYAFKKPPSAWVVLAKPNLGISSADVFKALDLDDAHHVDTEMCEKAIVEGDYKQLCESLSNRLEPVSMSMHPEIKNKNNMLQCGADGALMSGSGPTVYGLAQKKAKRKRYIMLLMVL